MAIPIRQDVDTFTEDQRLTEEAVVRKERQEVIQQPAVAPMLTPYNQRVVNPTLIVGGAKWASSINEDGHPDAPEITDEVLLTATDGAFLP